ncbi:hypothetical protein [Nocardia arizonensis]|uniref:hypothetical protein n=1 Tax=Nocardia arizonensis TaxID=1141647 RepID=UPI000AD8EF80|nr:hypothetical protein [Nocardia arizonensis]
MTTGGDRRTDFVGGCGTKALISQRLLRADKSFAEVMVRRFNGAGSPEGAA